MSVRPSFCPHWIGRLALDGFHEIQYLRVYRKSVVKVQGLWKSDKNKPTLDKYLCTFMAISCWILLRNRHVLENGVEKIKTHILCSITIFRKSCSFWDNVEECFIARHSINDNTIRRMASTYWVTKATNTYYLFSLLLFHDTNIYANRPQCSVIRSLLLLYKITWLVKVELLSR